LAWYVFPAEIPANLLSGYTATKSHGWGVTILVCFNNFRRNYRSIKRSFYFSETKIVTSYQMIIRECINNFVELFGNPTGFPPSVTRCTRCHTKSTGNRRFQSQTSIKWNFKSVWAYHKNLI